MAWLSLTSFYATSPQYLRILGSLFLKLKPIMKKVPRAIPLYASTTYYMQGVRARPFLLFFLDLFFQYYVVRFFCWEVVYYHESNLNSA